MLKKEEVEQWLDLLIEKLKYSFGERLLLAVHIGSWARDDAGEQSDIDVNVILDRVTSQDIIKYKTIIDEMPDKQLACGFLGGLNEMKVWPRYDLTAFFIGSKVLYGNVEGVIGEIGNKDILDNIVVMLSNINHAVRHSIIYNDDITATAHAMKDLYKAAFFVIQGWYLLAHGEYIQKRNIIKEKTEYEEDRLVLDSYEHWDENKELREENPIIVLTLLERWSSNIFDRLANLKV